MNKIKDADFCTPLILEGAIYHHFLINYAESKEYKEKE